MYSNNLPNNNFNRDKTICCSHPSDSDYYWAIIEPKNGMQPWYMITGIAQTSALKRKTYIDQICVFLRTLFFLVFI